MSTPETVYAGGALATDGSFTSCARHNILRGEEILSVWYPYTRGTSGGLSVVRVDWISGADTIPDVSPTGDATETGPVVAIENKITESMSPAPANGSALVVLHRFYVPPGIDAAIVKIAEADATKANAGTIGAVKCAAR